jgi:hypothetical protein
MRGKSARCPSCGGTIAIPPAEVPGGDLLNVDPLTMGNDPFSAPAASALNDPLAARPAQPAAAAAPAAASQPPWLLIGLGGGAAAIVLIVVVAVVFSTMGGGNRDVAEDPPAAGPLGGAPVPLTPAAPAAPASAPGTAASNAAAANSNPGGAVAGAFGNPAPSSGTGAAAAAPEAGGSATPSGSAASGTSSSADSREPPPAAKLGAPPEGGGSIQFLPLASHSWHNDMQFRRRGVIRVGDAETHYGHYSWLTQLLPFLGHQKEYDQINFKEGLTDGRNLSVGANVIPAFLNPLDDRQKWKGYPLQGLALTHFVGMSGIEDARNVVAATLPRSDPRAGVFGYDEVASPEQITDGTSQTIMVIGSGTMANPWIMGGGATVRGARQPYFDNVSGFGSRNLPQAGALTVMADGSVRFVSASVDPAVFRSLCTIHGAETVDLEKAAQPFLLESIAK